MLKDDWKGILRSSLEDELRRLFPHSHLSLVGGPLCFDKHHSGQPVTGCPYSNPQLHVYNESEKQEGELESHAYFKSVFKNKSIARALVFRQPPPTMLGGRPACSDGSCTPFHVWGLCQYFIALSCNSIDLRLDASWGGGGRRANRLGFADHLV